MNEDNHEIIVDRAAAIQSAIRLARQGDTVLIAGKGHEDYQEINGVKHPFSDVLVAQQALDASHARGAHMMTLSQAAQVLNGRVVGDDVHFTAVSSDSRKLAPGDLFVALRGENFDGYEFVPQAAQAGAAASLVNADSYKAHPAVLSPQSSILVVADTRLALGQLAAYWRRQFDIPLVAITGSNGKTTVKEMLAGILREAAGTPDAVLATQGNLNNDIGMPLTLLQAELDPPLCRDRDGHESSGRDRLPDAHRGTRCRADQQRQRRAPGRTGFGGGGRACQGRDICRSGTSRHGSDQR